MSHGEKEDFLKGERRNRNRNVESYHGTFQPPLATHDSADNRSNGPSTSAPNHPGPPPSIPSFLSPQEPTEDPSGQRIESSSSLGYIEADDSSSSVHHDDLPKDSSSSSTFNRSISSIPGITPYVFHDHQFKMNTKWYWNGGDISRVPLPPTEPGGCTLAMLPIEIHILIMEYLNPVFITLLGLTCKPLYKAYLKFHAVPTPSKQNLALNRLPCTIESYLTVWLRYPPLYTYEFHYPLPLSQLVIEKCPRCQVRTGFQLQEFMSNWVPDDLHYSSKRGKYVKRHRRLGWLGKTKEKVFRGYRLWTDTRDRGQERQVPVRGTEKGNEAGKWKLEPNYLYRPR
jgi:hypothetical protein